jgi:predicted MPP superfamily phosphohydrolase
MEIARRLALCVLVVALLPCGTGAQSAPARQTVTFVQLTDAHLFDDDQRKNSDALVWAITKINGLVSAGTTIDFVVYTGDLGLRAVIFQSDLCDLAPREAEKIPKLHLLNQALDTLAKELNELAVRKLYFVPGNNDLAYEELRDIGRYQCFLTQLRASLHKLAEESHVHSSPLELAALGPESTLEIGGIRLLGFNTASLKNHEKYQQWCSKPPETADEYAIWAACPQVQIDQLSKSLQTTASAVLFTHIPYLKDPHPPRAEKLPRAWDIEETLRAEWEQEACGKNVVAIFAGHFHDGNRDFYGARGRQPLRVTECVANKSWVAPPLAAKYQERQAVQARGLLLATITSAEVTHCTIYWFYGETGPANNTTASPCQ